jgi:hypothetical protein
VVLGVGATLQEQAPAGVRELHGEGAVQPARRRMRGQLGRHAHRAVPAVHVHDLAHAFPVLRMALLIVRAEVFLEKGFLLAKRTHSVNAELSA